MKKLFGTDGVRGKVNSELTPMLAFNLARCAAHIFSKNVNDKKNSYVVIGKDTRISGDMLESALIAGVCSEGLNTISVGVVPTPAMPKLIIEKSAICGIMISASHNPAEFNGIKFFDSRGLKLPDDIENEIETLYRSEFENNVGSLNVGRRYFDYDLKNVYIDEIIKNTKVDLSNLNIGVDLSNGSNYEIAKTVFNKLEVNATYIGDMPDGLNINLNCGSTYLGNLKKLVVEKNLDMGIAFDGDADRVLIVDELGNEIDGDRIMLALAINMKKNGILKNNAVVGTVMSNMGLSKALKNHDINFVATGVGDRYVLEEMLSKSYNIGGEQSGHIILLDYNKTGDGLSAAVRMLEVLKSSYSKASDITNLMKTYPQKLINVKVPNNVKYDLMKREDVKTEIDKIETELNGLGRVLLRASGTEPLVRVMVEAEDEKYVEKYCDYLAKFIENLEY